MPHYLENLLHAELAADFGAMMARNFMAILTYYGHSVCRHIAAGSFKHPAPR